MQQIVVYSINCISTCFGPLYAHRQESRLFEVSDAVHLFSMDERKTNLMQLYIYLF
jgi:hypothetical protein